MSALGGKPSVRVIVGVSAALFGWMLVAIALHKMLATGTCSSTGYTEYGPVPHCPHGSGWYGAFLTVGIILSVGSGVAIGNSNSTVPGLFVAIGVGSLLVAFSSDPKIGVVFPAVFGGCFVLGGLGWGAYAWNARPIRTRASRATAPAVPAIAGLGPAAEPGPRWQSIGLRPVIAVVVWMAVVAGALELGHAVAKHVGTARPAASSGAAGTRAGPPSASAAPIDITRAPLPRPTGATAAIGAASSISMFRRENLSRALDELTGRFGGDGSVVALVIYPGRLEAVLADGDGNARPVTAAPTGALRVGGPVPFEGSRQAVDVSQIHAGVPQRLARTIATRGGVPTARLDRFVLDLGGGLAAWKIYTVGGELRFEAALTGGHLERIAANGRKRIN